MRRGTPHKILAVDPRFQRPDRLAHIQAFIPPGFELAVPPDFERATLLREAREAVAMISAMAPTDAELTIPTLSRRTILSSRYPAWCSHRTSRPTPSRSRAPAYRLLCDSTRRAVNGERVESLANPQI